jgi:uncharacterized SAM-binding protein YcdF (DUF218 family)
VRNGTLQLNIFLSKFLTGLLYPIAIAMLLALIGLLLDREHYAGGIASAASIVVLGLSSMPVFSRWLVRIWESEFSPSSPAEFPVVDAIVLLGGLLRQESDDRRPTFNSAVDRVFLAAELFHDRKASRIVVAGGSPPWRASDVVEAVAIGRLLERIGVPRGAIIVEESSRNTRENALNTAGIFKQEGWHSALLVTSAAHMRRALDCFKLVGIAPIAAPADIQSRLRLYDTPLDLLPDVEALMRTTEIVKEAGGLLYYRARGWT